MGGGGMLNEKQVYSPGYLKYFKILYKKRKP